MDEDPRPNILPTQKAPSATDVTLVRVAAGRPAEIGADLGRYLVLGELGRGGMGVVYRAQDRTLGREVALKVLQGARRVDSETIERFQREARAAAALDHPNIVRVHDVGTLPNGSPYYTMEMLAGQDLSQAISSGRLAPKEAVEAVRQIAVALQFAHQRGILHRDIKPQNIFLREEWNSQSTRGGHEGRPYIADNDRRVPDDPNARAPLVGAPRRAASDVRALLLDFGLAKLAEHDLASTADRGDRSLQTLTRSGEIFGTPAYMPPEQTRGARDVDARADIYSLGAALYHALAGKPPFDASSLASLLEKVQKQDPSPPSASNGEVDRDLDTLCLKCLQKDPKDRYLDAAALGEDLRRWLAGEPIAARPIGLVGRTWRQARRNKAVAIPIALAVSTALAIGGLWAGLALHNRWEASRRMDEAERLLARGEYEKAHAEAADARAFAPKDDRVRTLLNRVCRAWGQHAADEYVRACDAAAALERRRAEEQAKPLASPEALDQERANRGRTENDLRRALEERGTWCSVATRELREALEHDEGDAVARAALAELYWEEYLRAEQGRSEADMAQCSNLLLATLPTEGARRIRGEAAVRVTFLLPEGWKGEALTAHLFRYARNDDPAVLAPVPCDPETGDLLGAPRLGRWQRVPLAETSSPLAREVRAGTAFPLRREDGNRVALAVRGGRAELEQRLPRGSYLLSFARGQGVCETRYPFEVSRDREWTERCALVADEAPPSPPALGALGGGEEAGYWAYLPPGPYRASGDPLAKTSPWRPGTLLRVPEGLPPDQVAEPRTEGCWMARFPATVAMYLEYLNDAEWHKGDPDNELRSAHKHVPRISSMPDRRTEYYGQDKSGRFVDRPEGDPLWPVFSIDWDDAMNYCAWLTRRAGGGDWRFDLPTEDEWERAARGAEGRYLPWGDSFDPTFCRMQASRPKEQGTLAPEAVGLFPLDESPFGVRDMAGLMSEWTSTLLGTNREWRVFKGGSWQATAEGCRLACRCACDPHGLYPILGFRLVARRVQSR